MQNDLIYTTVKSLLLMFIFLAEFKRVEEVHCTTYGFHSLMNQPT